MDRILVANFLHPIRADLAEKRIVKPPGALNIVGFQQNPANHSLSFLETSARYGIP